MARRKRTTPAGIKLNNPLQLRASRRQEWLGLSRRCPEKGGLCKFVDMEHGYLAALTLMHSYMSTYNLLTPAAIIYRWAPANEHKTHLYLAAVCALSGIDQNELIDDMSIEMLQLLQAMARMETGLRPDVTYLMDICGKYGLV